MRGADVVFSCAGASVMMERGHGWRGYGAGAEIGAAAGVPPRVRRAPPWLGRAGAAMLRPLHPRIAQFAAFLTAISTTDPIAPRHGRARPGDAFALAAAA